MLKLTREADQLAADVARRHGVSPEAAQSVLRSLVANGGTMAQFDHPDLGGMGQWSQGGMVMVGDMFNRDLKQRVDALCSDLAREVPGLDRGETSGPVGSRSGQPGEPQPMSGLAGAASGDWWPPGLGTPASSGAQNDFRYAYFPAKHTLAVEHRGAMKLYDTGEHRIYGVSQQQGGVGESPTFSSDRGEVRLSDFKPVSTPAQAPSRAELSSPKSQSHAATAQGGGTALTDPLALIERLAEMHQKGILSAEEYAAKKAELLGRV